MIKKLVIIRLALASLMIIIGAGLYLAYRQDVIFFNWIPKSYIETIRNTIINIIPTRRYFIVYCLPDGLWYGALLIFQSAFLGKTYKSKCVFWISILLPFIWETLQIFPNISDPFDPLDLVTYCLTLLIFTFLSSQHHD